MKVIPSFYVIIPVLQFNKLVICLTDTILLLKNTNSTSLTSVTIFNINLDCSNLRTMTVKNQTHRYKCPKWIVVIIIEVIMITWNERKYRLRQL